MNDSKNGGPPALVILIRHAEKPGESKGHAVSDDDTTDPNLAPLGYYRAAAYAAYFDPEYNGGLYPAIDHVFATKASAKSNRPVLTVTPLAAALGKKIHDGYDNHPADIEKLGQDVLGGAYAGLTLLICWHHGTMPDVAAALGYPNAPKVPGTSFDVVWTFAYAKGSPTPAFTASTENLMYDDAASLQTLDTAATTDRARRDAGRARDGEDDLSPDEALAVAAAFGIDVAGARAEPLAGGYSNDIVRVDARAGAYAVRRYGRLHVTRAAIAFEHVVTAHAAARMPEVVAPLRDPAGATVRTAPGGGLVAVYPYVAGTTGRRDLATGRAAARVLARFHRSMHDVHVAGGMRSARFLGILPWLRERFGRLAHDPLVARKLDWAALVVAVTGATARVAPHARALPHVVVHGDPNPGNVVVDDAGTVRGLIDFDFAHETERVYDLGTLLDEFARAGDDAPLDPARLGPLVEAYAEEAPLAPGERDLVPEAMLRRAAILVWYVATRHGERLPGDVGGAPRYAARVAEIVARRAEIHEALGG